jgi:hypothetical protein
MCYSVCDGIGLIVRAKEEQAMRKHWLGGLLGVSLALLLFGAVFAQDVEPSCPIGCPEPPEAGPVLFVTSVDNENNSGTGAGDDDMGYPDPPAVCWDYSNAPVEFNILVPYRPGGDGMLYLAACAIHSPPEQARLYLNDHFVANLPDTYHDTEVCEILEYPVPLAWLKEGDNLVEIAVVGEPSCVNIGWGALEVIAEEQFVPELGSIVLLGSGLAGLAGYATLRLRSGQALPWRPRE